MIAGAVGYGYSGIAESRKHLEETAICAYAVTYAATIAARTQDASIEQCLEAVKYRRGMQSEKFFRSEVDPLDVYLDFGAHLAILLGLYSGAVVFKEYVNKN